MSRAYIHEIDFIRAIAAFGIFMIHATGVYVMYSEFNSNVMHAGLVLNQFFRFGTPLFMIMTGLVLFYSYTDLGRFKPLVFYRKKAVYLVLPYLLWSVGYFLFTNYMYNVPIAWEAVLEFAGKAVVGEVHDHLYFIFLIIQFYLLFPLLHLVLSGWMRRRPWTVLAVSLLLQGAVLVYHFYFYVPLEQGFLGVVNTYFYKSVLAWFFYFILGGVIAFHYEAIQDWLVKYAGWLTLGFALWTVIFIGEVYHHVMTFQSVEIYEMYSSLRPQNMVYSTLAMGVLLWLTAKLAQVRRPWPADWFRRHVQKVGTVSLTIYFAHPMVLEWMRIKLPPLAPDYFGYGRMLALVLMTALAWFATLLFSRLLARIPFGWLLSGTPAGRPKD